MDRSRTTSPSGRKPPASGGGAAALTTLLVFAGGFLGTLARASLIGVIPAGWVSWPVLLANVTGALALGWLYAAVASGDLRRLLGTGFLGGFTTYSSLAVLTVTHGAAGAAYALVTLVLGLGACLLGVRLGARR